MNLAFKLCSRKVGIHEEVFSFNNLSDLFLDLIEHGFGKSRLVMLGGSIFWIFLIHRFCYCLDCGLSLLGILARCPLGVKDDKQDQEAGEAGGDHETCQPKTVVGKEYGPGHGEEKDRDKNDRRGKMYWKIIFIGKFVVIVGIDFLSQPENDQAQVGCQRHRDDSDK